MRKKQFKQLLILKYKKRVKTSGVVFLNCLNETEINNTFYASNRLLNRIISFWGSNLEIGGYYRYKLLNSFNPNGVFCLYKNTLLSGAWLDLLHRSGANQTFSFRAQQSAVLQTSHFLITNLIFILNVGILYKFN